MSDGKFLFCDTPDAIVSGLLERLPRPAAVVGVGNALRGDDAFGPAVVAGLEPSKTLRLFDVQAVPESFLMPIVESGCDGVLFVDAAELGAEPGRVAIVPSETLAEVDVSTHAIALGLVAEAIQNLASREQGREVVCMLLGAQPADLKTADRLSASVKRAVRLAVEGLRAFAAHPPGSF
ncbi:MAG: hydrogenase maturation protease [Phycisphaerae bacterium]